MRTVAAAAVCVVINQKQARQYSIWWYRSNRMQCYHVPSGLDSSGQISRAFPDSHGLFSSRQASKILFHHAICDQYWRFVEENILSFEQGCYIWWFSAKMATFWDSWQEFHCDGLATLSIGDFIYFHALPTFHFPQKGPHMNLQFISAVETNWTKRTEQTFRLITVA